MKFDKLSDLNINSYYKLDPAYGGCFAKDTFAKQSDPHSKSFYVINMCQESNKVGTHWVCIYNVKPKYCLYFDSFGLVPPNVVLDWMKATNKVCVMSSAHIQELTSVLCGYYCIYIIDELKKGKHTFVDILMDSFTPDPKKNEIALKNYFYRNPRKYYYLTQ